jgi:NodT family efflux transporter outer membrane factor (OMF) lipoprotein
LKLSLFKNLAPLLLLPILAGCNMASPRLDGLEPALPAHFDNAGATGRTNVTTDWVALFGVAELTSLSRALLDGSFDLDAAGARIAEAEAQSVAAGSALYPQVNADADASRSMTPGTLRRKEPPFTSSVGNRFGLGITASYALDFWGRNRALAQAGKLSATATRYDYETVAITSLAALCNAYFQMAVAQDRLRLGRENIRIAERALNALRQRLDAGTGNALDIAQQETLLSNQRASIPVLEQQEQQNRNLVALLAGRTPESLRVRGARLNSIALPRVNPGLPSSLLLRRPDIAAAEARLEAADANIVAARAAFYPSITLTAGASLESIALKNLLRPEALALSVASGLTQPIFNGYNLEAQLEANRARWLELLAAYRKAIVTSLTDVENALIAVRKTAEAEAQRSRSVISARRALDLTEQRLREGTIDVIVLLTTQQSLFNAQDALSLARYQRLAALVSLFQALGGGFTREPLQNWRSPAVAGVTP